MLRGGNDAVGVPGTHLRHCTAAARYGVRRGVRARCRRREDQYRDAQRSYKHQHRQSHTTLMSFCMSGFVHRLHLLGYIIFLRNSIIKSKCVIFKQKNRYIRLQTRHKSYKTKNGVEKPLHLVVTRRRKAQKSAPGTKMVPGAQEYCNNCAQSSFRSPSFIQPSFLHSRPSAQHITAGSTKQTRTSPR